MDGLCSGAIARKFLGDNAVYQGWDYGQDIPDLTAYTTVYLIDISFPRAMMVAHQPKLVWIDHHKSAIEENQDLVITGLRVDGVAACRLAWQWFSTPTRPVYIAQKSEYVDRRVEEPYAVQLLGEYDIWNHTNADTVPFQYGINSLKTVDWDRLFCADRVKESANGNGVYGASKDAFYVQSIIDKGRAIETYVTQTNAEISVKRGFDVRFEGLLFRALNIARSNSLTFAAAIRPEHDGCLSYSWDGKRWKISLYSVAGKSYDMSLIASKFGGGGHYGAAGFALAVLPRELGGKT